MPRLENSAFVGSSASLATKKGVVTTNLGLLDAIALTTEGAIIVGSASGPVAETGATLLNSLNLGASNSVSFGSLSLTTPLPVTSGGTGGNTAATGRNGLELGLTDSPTFQGLTLNDADPVGNQVLFKIQDNASNLFTVDAEGDVFTVSEFSSAGNKITLGLNSTSNQLDQGGLALGSNTILWSHSNSHWSFNRSVSITGDLTISGSLSLPSALPITSGGTGGVTATAARTSLGLEIGSDVQAYSVRLSEVASLPPTSNGVITGDGNNFVIKSGSALIETLGLGTLSTLNSVNNNNWNGTALAVTNGGTGSTTAAGARTALGVDVPVTLAGSRNYLTLSNQEITVGEVDISDDTNLAVDPPLVLTGDTLSIPSSSTSASGFMSSASFTKLDGIEANADVTDATNVAAAGAVMTEVNDLSSAVTWVDVPTTNITQDSVTQHVGAIDHDSLSNFVANEHIDWTSDQGSTNIHTGNYTNTTYTSSDFTHDDLTGFVANEHIDWTVSSQGTIHSTNIPAIALTTVQTAANQTAHLALTAEEGDVVVRSDENKSYVHNGGSAGDMTDYTLLATPTDAVLSVDGATGAVALTHDGLSGFVANEHIDWTADQGSTNIHAGNYTNTTYTSSDFTHDDLTGFVASEHIDWTASSAGTIHASNYVDNDTTYSVGNSGLVPSEGTSGHYLAHDGSFAQVAYSQISGTPSLSSYITASSTDTLTNKSGNISQWTNDAGYLTSSSSAQWSESSGDVYRSTGNVGIGTVPSKKFHVDTGEGELTFHNDGPYSNANLRIWRNDTSIASGNPIGYLSFAGSDAAAAPTDHATIYADAAGTHASGDNPTNLKFQTTADGAGSPADRMTIRYDGNVGIGTTDPSSTLHLSPSSGSAEIRVERAANAATQIRFKNTVQEWLIGNSVSVNNKFSIRDVTDSRDAFLIDGSGNVGIGETDPSGILHTKSDDLGLVLQTSATANKRMQVFFQDSGGAQTGRFGNDISGGDAAQMQWVAGSGSTPQMTLTSDGELGIGTTDPATKLDVFSGSGTKPNDPFEGQNQLFLSSGSTANAGLTIAADDGTNDIVSFFQSNQSADVGLIGTQSNHALRIRTNNSDRITILGGGNVGIGQTSPLGLLHLKGSNTLAYYEESDASANNKIWKLGAQSEDFVGKIVLDDDTGGNNWLEVKRTTNTVDSVSFPNGKVGIGTGDPVSGLEVWYGEGLTISNSTSPTLIFKEVVSNTRYDRWAIGNGSANNEFVISDSDDLTSARVVVMPTTGNVGIGDTSPENLLSIRGASPILSVNATGSTDPKIRLMDGDTMRWDIYSDESGSDTLYISDDDQTRRFAIQQDGKVGIGTATPSRNLEVAMGGVNEPAINIKGSTHSSWTDRATIGFNYNGSDTGFIIGSGEGDATKDFYIWDVYDGASRFFIDTDGNIGIGTTTPDTLLHVRQASGTTLVRTETAANSTTGFDIKKTGATTQHWRIADGQTANGKLEFYDVTDSRSVMTFDGSGNVGIGTTSPGSKLSASLSNTSTSALSTSSVGALQISNPNNTDSNYSLINFSFPDNDINALIGAQLIASSNGTADLVFGTRASGSLTEKMRITSGGNVGIGTNSPGAELEVDGEVLLPNNKGILFKDSSSSTLGIKSDTSDRLTFRAGGSWNRMVIDSGNVGIGTVSPQRSLHVVGNYIRTDEPTNPTVLLRETTNDREWGVRGLTDKLTFMDHGNNATYMVIDTSGNVGIGTTSPNALLQVAGDVNVFDNESPTSNANLYVSQGGGTTTVKLASSGDSYITSGNVGIGTTDPQNLLHVRQIGTSSNSYYEGAIQAGGASSSLGGIFGYSALGSGRVNISNLNNAGGANATIKLGFGAITSGEPASTMMTVNQLGNVGIGTTDPGSRLHVNGTSASDNGIRISYNSWAANGFKIEQDPTTAYLQFKYMSGSSVSKEILSITYNEGDVLPANDNTQDLGSSSKRWANLHVGDVQLNNEGSGGNEIDGTEGKWTIQEGEDELFIINRKNGKKYKFKLEEVE